MELAKLNITEINDEVEPVVSVLTDVSSDICLLELRPTTEVVVVVVVVVKGRVLFMGSAIPN